jgi:hypothetical protein
VGGYEAPEAEGHVVLAAGDGDGVAIDAFHVQRDFAEPDDVRADGLSAVRASGKVGGGIVERLVWKRYITAHTA